MTESSKPTIRLAKDGPLMVEGLERFTNSRGEPIETKKTVALCRCGASSNKPFCDGTHARVGFTDHKHDDRTPDKLDTYKGKGITVLVFALLARRPARDGTRHLTADLDH